MHKPGYEESQSVSRGEIAGVCYSRGTRQELCGELCEWLRSNRRDGRLVTYINPHVFNLAQRNQALHLLLRTADVIAVDGIGFAAAVRWLTGHRQTRTVMTPLFDEVVAAENLPEIRAVLIGGRPQVMECGAATINQVSRRIRVIATCNGYATEAEHLKFLEANAEVGLVLLAMGSPRSEQLMIRARDMFAPKIFWNIGGGTLHFYAGTLKRVPERVSRLGLQWAWRIVHEPAIAPRYVVGIPRFLFTILRYRFRAQPTNEPEKVYGSAYR